MSVDELSRDQLIELKIDYMQRHREDDLSYADMAYADEIVSDEEVKEYYGDTIFSPDDFLCSAGQKGANDD